MSGPIYKQYYASRLSYGYVTAMDNDCDIHYLLVSDDNNLQARLQSAMKASPYRTRIVVLEHDDRTLGVDVIPDKLHNLARKGFLEDIKRAIKWDKTLINKTDDTSRKAIFEALQHRQYHVIRELVNAGTHLDIIADINGESKTAMEIARIMAQDSPEAFPLLELFLTNGATPTVGVDDSVTTLITQIARGDEEVLMIKLLEDNIQLDQHDRLGYTALHEAACFGRYEIAQRILEKYRKPLPTAFGGVLHAVVDRPSYRQFMGPYRSQPEEIAKVRVKILDLLLRHGFSGNDQRHTRTVRDLVSAASSPSTKSSLQQMLLILRSHSTD